MRRSAVVVAGIAAVATALPGCASAAQDVGTTGSARVVGRPLDVPAGYTATAEQVAFTGPQKGWLVIELVPNGRSPVRTAVLSTGDGGTSWSAQWEGVGTPGQLVVAGSGHAFLTVGSTACLGVVGGYCPARLISLAWAPGAAARLVGRRSSAVTSMAWTGRTTGIESVATARCRDLWSSPPPNQPSCPSSLQLTTDGGAVFRPVLHTGAMVLAVAGERPSRWWAVTDTWLRAGNAKDHVFASRLDVLASNGARLWHRVGIVPLPPDSPAIGPRTTASLVVHGAKLVLNYADLDSCAMHGCGTAATWESTDGGRHWAQLPYSHAGLGCGPTLDNPAAFSPAGVLYQAGGVPLAACSPPGGWLSTWHGGRWAQVASWLGGGLASVSWPAKATGYVVVNGAVARTSDSGRSWVQVWPALAPTGPLAPLSATAALGAGDAVDAGALLRTDDGGRHWSVVGHLPGDVTSLALTGKASAEAAVLDATRGTWALYKTNSGGKRWERAGVLPSTSSYYSGIVGLWAHGPGRVLVLTATGAGVYDLSGIAPARLWETRDGGAHWSTAKVPLGQLGSAGPAAFVWEHGQWRGVVSDGTGAEATSDGGRHWAVLPGVNGFGGADALPGGFIATWVGTGNGTTQQLSASSDGGRRWRKAALPSGQAVLPIGAQRTLAFVNARDGWWDNGSAVFTTRDGGLHWAKAGASGLQAA